MAAMAALRGGRGGVETAGIGGTGKLQKLDEARFSPNVKFFATNLLKFLKTAKEIFGKT
jgi:hypothetical protein